MNIFLIFLISFLLGNAFFYILFLLKKKSFELLGLEILKEADQKGMLKLQTLDANLKKQEIIATQEIEKKWLSFTNKVQKEETRIENQEAFLEKKVQSFEKKISDFERKKEELRLKEEKYFAWENQLKDKEKRIEQKLEEISTLSKEEAESKFLEHLDINLALESSRKIQKATAETEASQEIYAKKILATAIHRLAIPCSSELTSTTVPLPDESMKKRIIGREGRNIRLLEELCGVNLSIDDTPATLLISGFDPIRKEIAKKTLISLLQDGRIHPTKIEETVKYYEANIDLEIREYGTNAAKETGVLFLHPDLIYHLGLLYFRTNIGQNVLKHSIEVSFLMGIMAAEFGLDIALAKRIGLLHDIGKALPLDQEGSHALAGQDYLLKHGEKETVANGVGAHHEEISPITIEATLCVAANKISGERQGARSLNLEKTFKRMKKLEELSLSFEGVIQAYALQAGKEIRVVVSPQAIDDHKMIHLARTLAKKIEEQIPHSGKIKVTLIRQTRAVSYAL